MPPFLSDNLIILGIVYLLACSIITIEASKRGWESMGVFLVAVLCSPVIAALLYAPYKDEGYQEKMEKERPKAKERVNAP